MSHNSLRMKWILGHTDNIALYTHGKVKTLKDIITRLFHRIIFPVFTVYPIKKHYGDNEHPLYVIYK